MKEKRRLDEDIEEIEDFYYEIIGILIILLSIISYLELGIVGWSMKVFLRLFFGDWFFIVNIFALIYGSIMLSKRVFINYKSQRFIGFYIFIISLLTISHFPISNFIREYTDNELIGTWELFMEYLGNYNNDLIMGGGIIGAFGFFLFSFLLGDVGVVLITIILLVVSISFMFERSISDSLMWIRNCFSNINISLPKVKKYFVFEKNNIRRNNIKSISINQIKDYIEEDNSLQNKSAINTAKSIVRIIKLNNIGCEIIEVRVSHQITRYVFKIFDNFKTSDMEKLLISSFSSKTLFKKEDQLLVIEECNKFKKKIGLKESIKKCGEGMLLGITTIGEAITTHNKWSNSILVNVIDCNIKNNLIENIYIQKNITSNPETLLFKFYDKCNVYKNYFSLLNVEYTSSNFDHFINLISNEIDDRLSLFNHTSTNSVKEFNNINKIDNLNLDDLKNTTVIINGINRELNNENIPKLLDLIKLGNDCGYDFFIIVDNSDKLNNYFVNTFGVTISYSCRTNEESECFIYKNYATKLEGQYDTYIKIDSKINRTIIPYISSSNIDKIHNKLIEK